MPVKKSASAKQPTRRSAGRPPKARPASKPLAKPRSAKAVKMTRQPVHQQSVKKMSRPSASMAQPKVVVVTNQPLITEEEFTVWQTVRQEVPTESLANSQTANQSTDFVESADLPSQPVDLPQRNWSAENSYLPDEVGDQRSGLMYRRLALFFIGLVAIVVMAMFYYSLIRVKIILYPANSQQSQTKTIALTDAVPVAEGAVPAKFLQASTEYRQTFKATGQGQVATGTGKLIGQVTLINTTAKDQPLRATTRLLTANGVLYRLTSYVNVPAGGQVSAEASADQAKPENAVAAATKFTIPGLWAGLQDKIYAVAERPIDYQGGVSQLTVTATDLEQAINQAKQTAAEQVKSKLAQDAGSDKAIYWLNESAWTTSSDAQVGAQKAEFTITVKASAGAAIIAPEAIEAAVADDGSSLKVDNKSVTYELSAWQPDQHQAQLKVNYSTSLSADQAGQLLDKKALVGMSRQQLDNYLASQPNLISYKVVWQPGFLNKVPGTDKIQLQLGQ